MLDLNIMPLPFDGKNYQVDIEAAVQVIQEKKPRLVFLGSSNYLFPTPIKTIADACHDVGSILIVDASHVLGLIAGGVFPQPFDEGADLILSSTHKTFSGPQGGIILARKKEFLENLSPAVFPGLVTNHHLMRVPAMIALFAEWKTYGKAYAEKIVENAIALADTLEEKGIPVVRTSQGPTLSHTILIKTETLESDSDSIAEHLENCNIMAGATVLPEEHGGEGLRLGVQEVTRMGLDKDQIEPMAELIKDAVRGGDQESIIKRVAEFTENLQTIHFCDSC
jgi:glycine hydroxymethyltransferase